MRGGAWLWLAFLDRVLYYLQSLYIQEPISTPSAKLLELLVHKGEVRRSGTCFGNISACILTGSGRRILIISELKLNQRACHRGTKQYMLVATIRIVTVNYM